MKIFLTAAVEFSHQLTAIPGLKNLACNDSYRLHSLTDNPEVADIILFVDAHQHPHDWQLNKIRQHPLCLAYPQKILIYNEQDCPWCSFPGIYVSMPRSTFDNQRQRAYAYYKNMNDLVAVPSPFPPDLLFSFMGSLSHRLRERVFHLSHSRSYVENTTSVNLFDFTVMRNEQKIESQKRIFADIVARSKFVLCPRGRGVSSIRLYEVLAAGRVPVIISDEWVNPSGPAWEQFSLKVAEADIENIPALLESNEAHFSTMAEAAHNAYLEWFAPNVMFHRLAELCSDLIESGATRYTSQPYWLNRQYRRCAVVHAKGLVRNELSKVKNVLWSTSKL